MKMKTGYILMALLLCGCVTIPERNPARLPLLLNTFNADNNGIFEPNPELGRKFTAYAKECGTGIRESANKMSDLFASTLDEDAPDYLYLQQSGYLYEFKQCMTLVKDSIYVRSLNFRKLMMERRAAADASKPGEKIPRGRMTPTADPAFQKTYDRLVEVLPSTPDEIGKIILDFYLLKDYRSVNAWQDELNRVLTKEDNISPELFVARYFFRNAETKDIGYKMLEDYAMGGSTRALEIMDTTSGVKYRKEHPDAIARYKKIVEMHVNSE